MVEVVLVQCSLRDNQCQQTSKVLYTFTPSESYPYLLNLEPNKLVLLKLFTTELHEIIITFTDQSDRSLEIEGKVNLALLIIK